MGSSDLEIYSIENGFTNSYLIHSDETIMVDVPNRASYLLNLRDTFPFKLIDVKLTIITHGHFDHISSLEEIREVTDAKVAIHQMDMRGLEGKKIPVPKGVTLWGRISRVILNNLVSPFLGTHQQGIDLVISDNGLNLSDYGIPGEVIHTPGHTEGSISILLDSGEAFVGDLAMNRFPLCRSPSPSIYSNNPEKLVESWNILFEKGVETIYPGHGAPFPAEVIRDKIRDMERS
jgi:glyoxylase-like metal-dependent hydrolase (beta-lactamase superfamily II)